MKSSVQNRSFNKNQPPAHRAAGSKTFDGSSPSRSSSSLAGDKLAAVISKSLGKTVIATTTNGARFKGLLVNSDQSPLSVILKNPVCVTKPSTPDRSNYKDLPPRYVLTAKEVVDLEVSDVRLADEKAGFKTDTDISNARPLKERDLQQWVPDADVDPKLNVALEDDTSGWDQFKVNQEKFGIESTYDEHLYTTRINTSAPDYNSRLRKAEKLAHEIENDQTSDPHMLEERGKIIDNGLDEESKYSGVDRRGDELMAALKSVNLNASPTPDAGAHDDGIDPAIVSSSIQKSTPSHSSRNKKPDSIPAKPQVHQHESFRLNAQSEINSLKEFSANFKVPHKIPNDLLPILSKDKSKQSEILKKQQDVGSEGNSTSNSSSNTPQLSKKKMDPTKPAFKLNPKAAVFTPSGRSNQMSPNPPKMPYNSRSPNNPSPRSSHSRPYSSGSSGTTVKRHYQISPADFFGGQSKIPTKESQVDKTKKFKSSFSLFITAQKKAASDNSAVVIERAFVTPPTWSSTFDDTHDKLFPLSDAAKPPAPVGMPSSPYGMNPMMASPVQGVFPGAPGAQGNSKYPMSPQQHQAAAMAAQVHFQQMQAAMFYQQQYGQLPPGQPPMGGVYMSSGENTPFLPPQGMYPPYSGGSPVNSHMMMGTPYMANNHNGYTGHRRYSTKRSS